MMKQKYIKPEVSSVEFKMEQGYAASQGLSESMGSLLSLDWDDIRNDRDANGVHDYGFFGEHKTTHYFGGSTDNWD